MLSKYSKTSSRSLLAENFLGRAIADSPFPNAGRRRQTKKQNPRHAINTA